MENKTENTDYNLVFQQQLRFLAKSCEEFDKGFEEESIRIAGHLRTLLHDSDIKINSDSNLVATIDEIVETVDSLKIEDKKTCEIVKSKLNRVKSELEQLNNPQILSKSLLRQQNFDEIMFFDSSIPRGTFAFFAISSMTNTNELQKMYFGLLEKKLTTNLLSSQVNYSPLFKNFSFMNNIKDFKFLIFEDWWNKVIFDDGEGTVFSRKDLILYVANLGGNGHYEEITDKNYIKFKKADIPTDFFYTKFKAVENSPVLNSVRQIAFEFIYSISQFFEKE
ncbi:MAG: hypothetical protein JXL97_08420 [Bacteroidales bacterium]|nr:hypothetical protein [Bacteroidales bacterium]